LNSQKNTLLGYKETAFGWIPGDWRLESFGKIASLRSMKFNPDDRNNSHKCIELEHIQQNTGFISGYIDSSKQSSTKNKFFPGDVLFGKLRPYLRKYAHVNFEGVCSSEIWVLKNTELCIPEYLFLIVQSNRFVKFANKTSGTKMPRAEWDLVSTITFPIPTIPEQRKIAEILSTWDQAIQLVNRQISAKRKLKKALLQQLLTGKLRFPEFVNSEKQKLVQFGFIPEDWRFVPISKVAKQITRRNENGEEITVLSCTKYDGLVDSLKYFGKQIYSEDTSNYKIVEYGQFAYATNHIEEGSIGFQNLYDKGLVSPMYTVFESNDKIVKGFLYKILKTETYRQIFKIHTNATVNRRGSLRWSGFSKIKIPLPSLEEQKAIDSFLDDCEKEISILKHLKQEYQTQKKGLMQKLLSGKIRVINNKEEYDSK
jgi:type I restriction enzyme, S subunit